MDFIKRINTVISVAVLAVCAIAMLMFGWSATGWKAMAIPTGSMKPDIPPGSLVLVHRVPISSLKVGDVITHIDASDPKITLSHRIVKIQKLGDNFTEFITKGDANKFSDRPVVGSQVVGKVIRHYPDVGWVMLDAKNPWVVLPVVYFAGLLIIIEEVIRMRDYFKSSLPYRAPGFTGHEVFRKPNMVTRRVSQSAVLTTAFLATSALIAPSALAALHSNTVSLAGNRITVAAITKPPTCKGNNTNTVTINNTTTQTGSSGNVFVSGNKGNTGNVSSGSVSNNNTTTITVNQGC